MNLLRLIFCAVIITMTTFIIGCNDYKYKCDDKGVVQNATYHFRSICGGLVKGYFTDLESIYDAETLKSEKGHVECKAKGKFQLIKSDIDKMTSIKTGKYIDANIFYIVSGESGAIMGDCEKINR